MPIFRPLPEKPLRIVHNDTTVVPANSDAPKATLFTVPLGRKYTVVAVGTDQNAAAVDLLVLTVLAGAQTSPSGAAQVVVDMPTNRLPTDERLVPLYEVLLSGSQLVVGIRNGTGGGLTPQLTAFYTDEPA